jgi:hypothetical protein
VRAFAFLGRGAVDYLTGVRWPMPSAEHSARWLRPAGGGAVRASREEQLAWWLDDELWEVELAGGVRDQGRSLVAERGRLLRPIEAWTPPVAGELVADCMLRVRDGAVAALMDEHRDAEAARLGASADGAVIEKAAAHAAAQPGDASPFAGFVVDLIRFARDAGRPVRAASVAAYIAARALAGGNEGEPSYERKFEAERRRQASWLVARLAL